MRKITTALLLLFCSNSFANELDKVDITAYIQKIEELGRSDQAIRTGGFSAEQIIEVDKKNLSELKKIINEIGFPTLDLVGKEAHVASWSIVQHAVHDLDYMKYFLSELYEREDTESIIIKVIPYLHDRVSRIEGKLQKFGTQGSCSSNQYVIHEIEDPKKVGSLRKKYGLMPLDEYISESTEFLCSQ